MVDSLTALDQDKPFRVL